MPPGGRSALLRELLVLEVVYRRRLGERPTILGYCDRFPGDGSRVVAAFDEATDGAAPAGSPMPRAEPIGDVEVPPLGGPDPARYRPLGLHALGGLGEIHVAHDEEVGREVALKRIRLGAADHAEARLRFLREARITGRLEHPGIVPVYGLGRDADGRPFYVMRLIRGESLGAAIDRFHGPKAPRRPAGERALEFRRLLGRFLDACDAVAYAHSRGVIHRDLKPGNIMLGPYGETLVVDWGLAKVLGTPAAEGQGPRGPGAGGPAAGPVPVPADHLADLSPTEPGSAMGTPCYMSPEQAAGRVDLVGPASDVYSLGATLLAILTGGATLDGPAPPAAPPALMAVCREALATDPVDRYPTVGALARDVERWLADEPVGAYREPWHARLSRRARRHRTAVAAAAVLALTVAAALAINNALIRRERGRTEDQARRAQLNLADAVRSADEFFTSVSEDWLLREPGMQPLRRRLLVKALEHDRRLLGRNWGDPALAERLARAQARVGHITQEIGTTAEAIDAFMEARDRYRALLGDEPGRAALLDGLATVEANLGLLHGRGGDLDRGRRLLEGAVARRRSVLGRRPEDAGVRRRLAEDELNLGSVLLRADRPADAEAHIREAIALAEAAGDGEGPEAGSLLVVAWADLGMTLAARGDDRGALDAHRQAVGIGERHAASDPRITSSRNAIASCYSHIGTIMQNAGRHPEAEEALGKALAMRRTLSDANPEVLEFRTGLIESAVALAAFHAASGRTARAMEVYREAIAAGEPRADDARAIDLLLALKTAHEQLGLLRGRSGDRAGAAGSMARAVEIREALVADHPGRHDLVVGLAGSYTNLGLSRHDAGDARGALACYDRAISRLIESIASGPGDVVARRYFRRAQWARARAWAALGRPDEAERAYREVIDLAARRHPDPGPLLEDGQGLANTHTYLSALLEDLGRLEEAAEARRQAAAILEGLHRDHPGHVDLAVALAGARHNLGGALLGLGDAEGALAQLDAAVDLLLRGCRDPPGHPAVAAYLRNAYLTRGATRAALGRLHVALADYDAALGLMAGSGSPGSGPDPRPARIGRARVLARQGRHREAVAEAEAVLAMPGDPAGLLLDVAGLYPLSLTILSRSLSPSHPAPESSLMAARQGSDALPYFLPPAWTSTDTRPAFERGPRGRLGTHGERRTSSPGPSAHRSHERLSSSAPHHHGTQPRQIRVHPTEDLRVGTTARHLHPHLPNRHPHQAPDLQQLQPDRLALRTGQLRTRQTQPTQRLQQHVGDRRAVQPDLVGPHRVGGCDRQLMLCIRGFVRHLRVRLSPHWLRPCG